MPVPHQRTMARFESHEREGPVPRPIPPGKTAGISFEPRDLAKRQQLAAHVAVIAGMVTNAELITVVLLLALLKTESEVVGSLFTAVENEGARITMLKSTAEHCLEKVDFDNFTKVLSNFKKRRKERNDVVHGVWGIAEDVPDALVWIDPRDFIKWMSKRPPPGVPIVEGAMRESLLTAARLYDERDFVAIEDRLNQFRHDLNDFWWEALQRKGAAPAPPARPAGI